ncbi:MAG: threonine/homoserine/homoserine lactone efflux protein [Myxococcota bacterium]|jgi:threonine/homoserine/homoserine lactone efflux protein
MDLLTATLSGAALGLAGGLAPGPLTALVITQTVRHGPAEGLKVSLAPVLTDGPLLLLGALAADWMARWDAVLGVIGLAGAGFLFWLGLESLRAGPLVVEGGDAPSGGVLRAVLTNLLNPHPYLFWVTIGGPLVAEAWGHSVGSVVGFLLGFFALLCGTKAGIALLVGGGRRWLTGRAYIWAMRGMGVVMWGFAVVFAVDALGRLAG